MPIKIIIADAYMHVRVCDQCLGDLTGQQTLTSFSPPRFELWRKNRTNVLLYESTFVLFFSEKNFVGKEKRAGVYFFVV